MAEQRQPTVEYHVRIREMPASERPRERLRDYGPGSLNNAELLAIILRVGTAAENAVHLAERLLATFGCLPGLYKATFGELRNEHGLGEAKAAQLQAALELGKRLLAAQPEERATVRSPQDVANLLRGEMALLEQEHLRVVLLNTRNQVMGVQEIYKGSVNAAQVRVGEVLRPAVRENCPALVVVHNHPSGDPTPSPQDIAVTKELVEAGKLLDIEVLDHIIIGQGGHVSMKERGLGFG
ncbi:MAG TPA: DNA repair protein RadC [Dehalococcoidia bacterium]|nr:DNA repair protein RadC [Dehalococcoidia bacterium]